MAKTLAQPVASGLVPLDELTVRVLVDNVTDSLSTVPPGVVNESATLLANGNLRETAGEARCCAEHGLSLVITARVGNTNRTVVFDAGPEAYPITRNGALPNIPFGDVDAVVLSHGHFDHSGGLVEVVRQAAAGRAGKVECHVNPGMFTERATYRPGGGVLPQKALPTPDELAEAGALVVNDFDERRVLVDRFYLSAEIPRETAYEHGFAEQLKRAECDLAIFATTKCCAGKLRISPLYPRRTAYAAALYRGTYAPQTLRGPIMGASDRTRIRPSDEAFPILSTVSGVIEPHVALGFHITYTIAPHFIHFDIPQD